MSPPFQYHARSRAILSAPVLFGKKLNLRNSSANDLSTTYYYLTLAFVGVMVQIIWDIGSNDVVLGENKDMKKYFDTEDQFVSFLNSPYQTDRCGKCGGIVEASIEPVYLSIDGKILDFEDLPLLKCMTCGNFYLTDYAKDVISGCYSALKKRNDRVVRSRYNGYRKKYNYCPDVDFDYDHRDYNSIPGLCYDDEHSEPGFLQPVYFSKDALIAFVGNPEYEVDLFSETYGQLSRYDPVGFWTYEWGIPLGFNKNRKLVLWLGDIDTMDLQSQRLLKAFNIPSDHLIVDSEFYQAQMNCVFSQPSIEKQIIREKKRFIKNIERKYGIDLRHLTEQDAELEEELQRPIAYTKSAIIQVINAFRRHLIEGIDANGLKTLYEMLYDESSRDKGYKNFGTIKLTDKVLERLVPNSYSEADVKALIAPLYLLNDYRTILDHSIGSDEEMLKKNILDSLGIDNFDKQEQIYLEEIRRLRKLYQMLALLTE